MPSMTRVHRIRDDRAVVYGKPAAVVVTISCARSASLAHPRRSTPTSWVRGSSGCSKEGKKEVWKEEEKREKTL
jgi:hypothetical protein